jgi:hypothetical protein
LPVPACDTDLPNPLSSCPCSEAKIRQIEEMEVDSDPKLTQLYRSIAALNESVRQHVSEFDAAPEHVRKLWAEIEELKNLVQHGRSLNMNFDILDASRRGEAAEIVQNASNVVDSLRIALDTICGHDTAQEITATLSEQECEKYIRNISEYRDKLAGTLDILQMLVLLLALRKAASTNTNPSSAYICDVWQPQCIRIQKLFDISRL